MKYRFIGTEQDLIDNGFTYTKGQGYWVIYGHMFHKIMSIGMYASCAIKLGSGEVRFIPDEYDIQDLIDKGLVVEE